jgi:putative transposase
LPYGTGRRWLARVGAGDPVRGPWPMPVSSAVEAAVVKHAEAHVAWGHRKVWAMTRYDGHQVSPATVLRILRRRGLILAAGYQRERRQLAAARRAAFVTPPAGPNRVWQLDFSEFETAGGGVWRIAACTDYWSKYELGWHLSLTANQHDAVAAVEAAIGEAEMLAGGVALAEQLIDHSTGQIRPVTIVTDNGGPFRSARFAAFIAARAELHHVRTGVRTPGQNGVRERGFESLKYERVGAQNSVWLSGLRVLVKEAAEPVAAGNPDVLARTWVGKRPLWRCLAEGTVRTVLVEVPLVFGHDRDRVTPVEDEDPVQQLPPQAAHEPFGDGVRLGRPYRRGHDLHAGRGDDSVEDPAELGLLHASSPAAALGPG